ncbi:MAG: sugar ABC transporter ATP-binding protein [Planctomyces sp.]|nr:sugar ABC transporter ATP-binding protein [Planctomyces sp.]
MVSNEPERSQGQLLELREISKSFPGVRALHQVSLQLNHGEILGLMGENGAGKSTLIKVLAGVFPPDHGEILISGKSVRLDSPFAAAQAGVGVIHQELSLIPTLDACANLTLGKPGTGFWNRSKQERREARRLFEEMGVNLPLGVPVRELSVAQQQLIEIVRVVHSKIRILVLDEPTAALSPQESEHLFRLMRDLRSRGIGMIYISHRLEEVLALTDRVQVLRDGESVATEPVSSLDRRRLIELMVGRSLDREFLRETGTRGELCLTATGLCRGASVQEASLSLYRHEIVGLTGLVGAGRTELARLLFGADPAERGQITINGVSVRIRNPREAISAGICFLSEDRKAEGIIPARSVCENFSIANLDRFQWWGWMNRLLERTAFRRFVDSLRIRISGMDQPIRNLSGGNQQKVLLARWLEKDADVYIFDEPTRGVDVGARQEIYQLISALADSGKAVLLISSELAEVFALSDRIIVMRAGRIAGEISDVRGATQEDVMELATGL